MCRALQNQDEAAALAVLCAAPSGSNLAWVRDHESGGYPAHIAAYYGLGKVLQQLVDTHGKLLHVIEFELEPLQKPALPLFYDK